MKTYILELILVGLLTTSCVVEDKIKLSTWEIARRDESVSRLLTNAIFDMRLDTKENLEQAEAALLIAKELNVLDPRVWDGLGSIEYRRENYELAEKYFRKSIKLNPSYDRPYMHLALIAEKKGDILASYQLLRIALHKNPMNYKARNNLATLLNNYSKGSREMQNFAHDEIIKAGAINNKEQLIQKNKNTIGNVF
jgi:tetratricopeptide (TPR) repeat protein